MEQAWTWGGLGLGKPVLPQQLHHVSTLATRCESAEERMSLKEVFLKPLNPPAPLLLAPTVYILWSRSNT